MIIKIKDILDNYNIPINRLNISLYKLDKFFQSSCSITITDYNIEIDIINSFRIEKEEFERIILIKLDYFIKNYNIYNKEYVKKRRKNDPLYKLTGNIRTLISTYIKRGGYTKKSKTATILGCSFEEFISHLNDNIYGFTYGDEDIDLDHIVPISSATTEEELIKLNHYTNYQLLPLEYNRYVKRERDWNKEEFELWFYK